MNWYYYDQNGEKIGPISSADLKALAAQGIITPETKVENQNGRSALAGKVNGLTFPDATAPKQPNVPAHVPFTAEEQAEIEKLLAHKGSDVEAADEYGNTMLAAAIRLFGKDKVKTDAVVKYLVSQGANVNVKAKNGLPPLHFAIMSGHVEVAKFLIAQGADVNAEDKSGSLPIHLAAMQDANVEIAELLVARGADVNVKDKKSLPIETAATLGQLEMTKALVALGADIPSNLAGIARLMKHTALAEYLSGLPAKPDTSRSNVSAQPPAGDRAVIEGFFTTFGSDVAAEAVDEKGNTLLDIAVLLSVEANPLTNEPFKADTLIALIEQIISKGANVNAKGKNGLSPLYCASLKGQVEIAKYLVSQGADVNTQDNNGASALHAGVSQGHVGIAEFLVSQGADVNGGAYPPIALTVMHGNLEMTQALVSLGADVHWRNPDDDGTLTDLAKKSGHATVAHYLSNLPAKPHLPPANAQPLINPSDAFNAAMNAASNVTPNVASNAAPGGSRIPAALKKSFTVGEQAEIENFLARFGSDVHAANPTFGRTLLHAAVTKFGSDYKTDAVVKYLVSQGANVNAEDKSGQTPLSIAAKYGHLEIIRLLVSQGADVNAVSKHGQCQLYDAVADGQLEAVKLLVSLGADAQQTWLGESLLDTAKKKGQTAMVEYLSNLSDKPDGSPPDTPGKILYEGAANRMGAVGSTGGQLTLTSEALVFKPHAFNFQTDLLTMPLEQCDDATTYNVLLLIPNGMRVKMKNGLTEKFVVYGRKIWVEKIQEAITSKSTGRDRAMNTSSAPAQGAQAAPAGIWATLTTKSTTLAQSKLKAKMLWWICLGSLILTGIAAAITLPTLQDGAVPGIVLITPPALLFLVSFFWAIGEWGGQSNACPNCEKLNADQIIREETVKKTKKMESRTKETGRIKHSGNRPDTVITSTYEVPVTVHYIGRYHQCKFCQHNWTDMTTRTTDGWES